MDENVLLFVVLLLLNAPLFYFAHRLFFRSRAEFFKSVGAWLRPDYWSVFIPFRTVVDPHLVLYAATCIAVIIVEIEWLLPILARVFS